MEREAFARAWRYLSYDPAAKWLALLAAVGTGVLYLALLVVLGLYADLMVSRGQIPAYRDLRDFEQDHFLQGTWLGLGGERDRMLRDFGVEEKAAASLGSAEISKLTPSDQALLWRAYVHWLLTERLGEAAGDLVVPSSVARPYQPPVSFSDHELADRGVLSLVVRGYDHPYGRLVSWMARLNPWMWRHGNRVFLASLLVLAVVIALLRAVLMNAMTYLAARATLQAVTRLRRAVYHHTFRLGTLAFRALGPSEAASIFTRHLESIHHALYAWLTVVFREPVKFFLLIAFAILVNLWLALAFIFFALLVWLIGGQAAAYFRRQGRAATQRAAEQLALIQESLMMMRLVKCYLMELFNQARVERQLARYARVQLRRYRGEAIYRPLLVFLGVLAAVVLLFVAGIIVLNGRLGVASGITMAAALVSTYWPLVNWMEHRRLLERGASSAVVLFKFLDRPGDVGQLVGAAFLPPLSRQLEFDDVSLREPGTGKMLIQGVSMTIQAGEKLALVGSDEMEKYALVYLIPRFLDPNGGEIRIDNNNLRWVTLDSLRAQMALVMQHNLVFNDTAANNIGCGDSSYTLPQIIEAAKVAHAHQFIQKLPQGYETHIGEMGHPLNHGERFRIALARAILRDPALLIIEEPFQPLDADTKALLDDTFARVLPGRTALFLPHRISTIKNCDRILLLHKCRIEATGTHRDLLAQNELYRHLHYLEFNEVAEQLAESRP